jgi:hypothetical protein
VRLGGTSSCRSNRSTVSRDKPARLAVAEADQLSNALAARICCPVITFLPHLHLILRKDSLNIGRNGPEKPPDARSITGNYPIR